jgi:hypothetical protein
MQVGDSHPETTPAAAGLPFHTVCLYSHMPRAGRWLHYAVDRDMVGVVLHFSDLLHISSCSIRVATYRGGARCTACEPTAGSRNVEEGAEHRPRDHHHHGEDPLVCNASAIP